MVPGGLFFSFAGGIGTPRPAPLEVRWKPAASAASRQRPGRRLAGAGRLRPELTNAAPSCACDGIKNVHGDIILDHNLPFMHRDAESSGDSEHTAVHRLTHAKHEVGISACASGVLERAVPTAGIELLELSSVDEGRKSPVRRCAASNSDCVSSPSRAQCCRAATAACWLAVPESRLQR